MSTTTNTIAARVVGSCPTCGESVDAPDTRLGKAFVHEFTKRHAGHELLAGALADAVEAVLDGYGKSGQGTRMSGLASALHAYRSVTR